LRFLGRRRISSFSGSGLESFDLMIPSKEENPTKRISEETAVRADFHRSEVLLSTAGTLPERVEICGGLAPANSWCRTTLRRPGGLRRNLGKEVKKIDRVPLAACKDQKEEERNLENSHRSNSKEELQPLPSGSGI
jgi:cellulose synthase/poly-beta-1,6-N-acetylglucosamine synthase-like glycosyltransferase